MEGPELGFAFGQVTYHPKDRRHLYGPAERPDSPDSVLALSRYLPVTRLLALSLLIEKAPPEKRGPVLPFGLISTGPLWSLGRRSLNRVRRPRPSSLHGSPSVIEAVPAQLGGADPRIRDSVLRPPVMRVSIIGGLTGASGRAPRGGP